MVHGDDARPAAPGHRDLDVVYLANVAAKRIGEGVVRGPAEVVASEASLARLGLTSTVWEDLLLTLPAAFEATLAQYTKD